MSIENSLLAMVLAHPSDDGPRAVYADYLEETGRTDRSQFIRDGLVVGAEYQSDVGEIAKTVNRLLPVMSRFDLDTLQVRRGFIEHVGLSWGLFVSLQNKLFWQPPMGHDIMFSPECPLTAHPITMVVLDHFPSMVFDDIKWEVEPRPYKRMTFITASWQVRVDLLGDYLFRRQYSIDDRIDTSMSYVNAMCQRDRTPLGYLSLRWPGITFTAGRASPVNSTMSVEHYTVGQFLRG